MSVDSGTAGTQSIQRAAKLLRIVASSNTGLRLMDICAASGLQKSTAHRMLSALIDEGFVDQCPQTRLYRLGVELFVLGCTIGERFDIKRLSASAMAHLSQATGDSVFLSVRHGFNALCIDRLEGTYPIKTLMLDIGGVRPLGVGAGGMALMAHLQDDEIEEIIERISPALVDYPLLSPGALRKLVQETRDQGYALNEDILVPGIIAIGAPVFDTQGRPIAALSVAAIAERMSPERQPQVVAAVLAEAQLLSRKYPGLKNPVDGRPPSGTPATRTRMRAANHGRSAVSGMLARGR